VADAPFTTVAVKVASPAAVALNKPVVEFTVAPVAPAFFTLQVIVLFVAAAGLTVPVSVLAVFTVAAAGRFVMLVTGTKGAFTQTVHVPLDGEIVNPAALLIVTVTFWPFATVIFEIFKMRVVPVPVSVPFVAPVTVMSLAASAAGSALKFNVNAVVVTLPLVPLAARPLHVMLGDFTQTVLVPSV